MHCDNIYQLFTPIHPAWLYRQHAKKLDVTPTDLDSIESAFPAAAKDPLFIEYRHRANSGTLRRRPGRKPLTIPQLLRLWAARFAIEDEMEAIWAKRRSGASTRARGDVEPCYQAAEIVARRFRFPCTGEWLLKRLSKEGIR